MNTATTPLRTIKARRSVMESIRRDLKTAPLTAWFGMIVILLYAICAIFAPLLAPYGESEIVGKAYQLSSPENWLGTDQIGRDTLSRLIFGARNTIGIALITTLLSFLVGGSLGVLAALKRGLLDQGISRVVDAFLAIPVLIFALMMLAVVGKSLINLIIILALLDATRVFRLSRAVALNSVVMDYVESAQAARRRHGLDRFPGNRAQHFAAADHRVRLAFLFRVSHDFRALLPWRRHSAAHRRLGFNGG